MTDHGRRLYRTVAAMIAALWIAGGIALDCGAVNTGIVAVQPVFSFQEET